MKYSIMQSTIAFNKFAVINGSVSPAGYPIGNWHYLNLNGKAVLDSINIQDAREICTKLNAGASVSDFFVERGNMPAFY